MRPRVDYSEYPKGEEIFRSGRVLKFENVNRRGRSSGNQYFETTYTIDKKTNKILTVHTAPIYRRQIKNVHYVTDL